MSQKVDPKLVLSYLNELGFTNINAEQLKDFIIDLKKLIKHDKRYPDPAKWSGSFCNEYLCNVEESGYCEYSEECSGTANIHQASPQHYDTTDNSNNFHSRGVRNNNTVEQVTFRPEEVPKKDKLISVHIQKRPTENISHEHCIHIEQSRVHPRVCQNIEKLQLNSSGKEVTTESTLKSTRPDSRFSSQTKGTCSTVCQSKETKSKVAFIRQTKAKPAFDKCDPVALYHYYQSEWKRTKIPGQESRDDLRWAIRERMLGGPKVDVKPILRKRCSSHSVGNSWR